MSSAPPIPCRSLAPTSSSALGATAQSSEAAVNRPTPEHEDAAAPVAVAERSAEQDQRGERQQVAVEDPLQRAGRRAEVAADVGQRHVDDGAVEEGHARAQHGDGEHPAARAALVGDSVRGLRSVTRSGHDFDLTDDPAAVWPTHAWVEVSACNYHCYSS